MVRLKDLEDHVEFKVLSLLLLLLLLLLLFFVVFLCKTASAIDLP